MSNRSGASWLLAALAVLALLPQAVAAQPCDTMAPTNLCFHDLTAPNIIGDSNLNGQPDDGPRVFTIAARVCNYTGGPVTDLLVNVGDGTTPGTFPIATVPGSATYLDDNYRLELLPGATGQRFEGTQTLADGECLPFYFPVQYRVVDPNGDALWGKSNTTADDLPLQFSIWGEALDAGLATVNAAQLDDTVVIRNEITANPNKVQPNPQGETWYSLQYPTVAATRAGIPWDPATPTGPPAGASPLVGLPPPIAPGETITIYFRNPTFGNPNQGFDVTAPAGPDTDFWFQPIGETYWDPSAFRLVKVQSFHRGTGCNAAMEPAGKRYYYVDDVAGGFYMINNGGFETSPAFLPGMEHMANQTWYARELQLHDCNAWDAEWYGYTFIALDAGKSRVSPYQEVASGSDNEKYNGDYCGDLFSVGPDLDTPHPICVPLTAAGTPELDLTKTVDKTADSAGGTLTYTIDFANIGTTSVGSSTSGIQIIDAIPADTTFVAASATCSLGATCNIGYSTDGGVTYSSVEPAPASVTHLRWAVNQSLAPAATGTAGFQVVIDNPYGPGSGTVTNTARLRIDNGPFLLMDDAMTTVNLGQIQVHLFFDNNSNGMVDATDGNGVQDPGEPDLAGVDVQITENGGGMQTVTSDANGNVIATVPTGSTDLAVVTATVPAGYVLTTANDTQLGIVVAAGATASGTDIGYTVPAPTGVIGDFVWEDLNANGLQDDGATGIDGVTVELKTPSCTLGVDCPTTTTAGGGLYSFTGLPAGTYFIYVDETSIPGFPAPVRTTPNNPIEVVLGPNEVNNTADFGYETPIGGVIGDRVWADQNNDGIQDPGEPGLSGITVELQDGLCTPGVSCPTTVTGNGGIYLFNDLPPGNYSVVVLTPPGPAGPASPTLPMMPYALAQSEANLNFDFGFVVPNANIGDFVWNDLNGDGVQDGGAEVGIPNVIVELLFAEDTSFSFPPACTPGLDCPDCIPSAVPLTLADLPTSLPDCPAVATDASGLYLFDGGGSGLPPRQYRVKVHENTAPVGMVLSTPDSVTAPLSGFDFLTADFGFFIPSAMIGDLVWLDLNGNGIQDGGGEVGLDGVTVELLDNGGSVVQSTATAGGGLYSFSVTTAGNYSVRVTLPSGYSFSPQDQGGDDTVDSDVNVGTGTTAQFAVTVPSSDTSRDAGLVPLPPVIGVAKQVTSVTSAGGTLVDVAYSIVVENLGPVALQNVQVTDDLTATFPAPVTFAIQAGPTAGGTLTANGAFNGSGDQNLLNAGASTLAIGASATITFTVRINPNGANGPFNNVAVASGEDVFGTPTTDNSDDGVDPDPNGNNDPKDPGENDPTPVVLASVGDFVWEDTDGDGVQDVGEPGVDGVTVELLDGGGVSLTSTVTAGGGAYVFNGLAPGNYSVRVTSPTGYGFTLQDVGVDTTDSDVNPANGTTAQFAVAAGATITSVDAGLIPTLGIIGVAKQVTGVTLAGNGQVDVAYSIVVENLGTVALTNVNVTDNLTATFSAPAALVGIQAGPVAGGTLTANAGFNGAGDTNLLNPAASSLAIGASATITFTARFSPNGATGPFLNVAVATGEDPGGTPTTDISDDGVDPDPNGNSDPKDPGEDDPTPVSVAIVTTHVYEDTNGNTVQDVGEPDLPSIQVLVTGVVPTPSTNATGDISVPVLPGAVTCDVVEATLPAGYVLTTANEPDNVMAVAGSTVACGPFGYQPPSIPVIGLSKQVTSVTDAGGGNWDVTFGLVVENLGTVALSNVQVTDVLTATFPAPTTFGVISGPVVTGTLAANDPGFDGVVDQNLLVAAGSTLAVGASGTITFTVQVTPASLPASYTNTALASGQDPIGMLVSDPSDDSPSPDPNGNGDPGEPGENDPTTIDLVPGAEIPTLSEWGIILFSLLLALAAFKAIRQ